MDNSMIWMFILGVFSILFGIMMFPKGAPYNITISSFHKIFSYALGLVYMLVMYVHFKTWGMELFPLIITIIAVFSFFISVITGSILLNALSKNREMVFSHRFSSILAIGLGIYSLFLVDVL